MWILLTYKNCSNESENAPDYIDFGLFLKKISGEGACPRTPLDCASAMQMRMTLHWQFHKEELSSFFSAISYRLWTMSASVERRLSSGRSQCQNYRGMTTTCCPRSNKSFWWGFAPDITDWTVIYNETEAGTLTNLPLWSRRTNHRARSTKMPTLQSYKRRCVACSHFPDDQTLRLQTGAGEDDIIHLASGLDHVDCERQEEEVSQSLLKIKFVGLTRIFLNLSA